MYKVLIFSGGSGSTALQEGINYIYGTGRIHVDIVINGYDNGKSTGECRKVFDYQILGPSDMRKNQITQFKLIYAAELKNASSKQSNILKLFTMRISTASYQECYEKCKKCIETANLDEAIKEYFIFLLNYFFFENIERNVYREKIKSLCYTDFSLANVFYTACAASHNNMLSYAGYKMSLILGIPNNVSLISHAPLKLKGVAKSGLVVEDEAMIVSWHNCEDPIQDVYLCDNFNEKYVPTMDEGNSGESRRVEDMIREADIIIFSSGTQWSSLIPTYLHRGFREAIENSNAAKYLIMNNKEDEDMQGIDSEEICRILDKYINLSDIKIILNDNASDSLRKRCGKYQYIHAVLSDVGSKKHDPQRLVNFIFRDFFGKSLVPANLMSDFDGTLWDDYGDECQKEIGKENLLIFSGRIISGNSYTYLKKILSENCEKQMDIQAFCDYGNTFFHLRSLQIVSMLTNEYCVDKDLVDRLKELPGIQDKVFVRGDVVITIKPLADRDRFIREIQSILASYHGKYIARIAGRTSVDICKSGYHKATMIEVILKKYHIKREDVVYVGNELNMGNDEEVSSMGITVLPVHDIYECNVFLRTRLNYMK